MKHTDNEILELADRMGRVSEECELAVAMPQQALIDCFHQWETDCREARLEKIGQTIGDYTSREWDAAP